MQAYSILLMVHVTCALISIVFFIVRGLWMLADSSLLGRKFVRIAPHVIDTLLLLSALALTVVIGQYPFVNSWLTVKLLALVAYIALGVIALRRGKTKTIRATAFIAAILVFAFIVTVAITKDPLGIFAYI